MTAKHTPGPWACYQTSNYAHDYRLELPNGQMPFEGNDVARANAQMISATPELLDALIAATAALDNVGLQDTYIDFDQVRDAKAKSRAAIFKATKTIQ